MTRRKPEQSCLPLENAVEICECCGEPAEKLLQRWNHGLRTCPACFRANGAELAKAYCGRLRRMIER